MSNLTPGLLRSQLSAVRKKIPSAKVVGLRSRSVWDGEPMLRVGQEEFLVRQCNSELAMRESIIEAEDGGFPLVILTPLQDAQLGRDLLVRLARRKLLRLDVWDSLRDLFQAQNVDPRARHYQWLADALMEEVPSAGYKPAPNGIVTVEHIWAEFLCLRLRMPSAQPDARDLLRWALQPDAVAHFHGLTPKQKEDVIQWIALRAGDLGQFILRYVEKGKLSVLLSAGLACEVIFASESVGADSLRDAAIRLEKYTGEQPIPRHLGQRWFQSTRDLLEAFDAEGNTAGVQQTLDTLDRLMAELGIREQAWLSTYSLQGYEQRLERFAAALTTGLKKSGDEPVEVLWELAEQAQAHVAARTSRERVSRLFMACRLRQWLAKPDGTSSGFVDAARMYYQNGGFLDRARYELLGGEGNVTLAKAFAALLKHLDAVRVSISKDFATKLANWTEAGSSSPDLLPVENVLDRVCVPLAKQTPLLLVVLDGMSMAVYRQLIEDIVLRHKWTEYGPRDSEWPVPCIAALPTVTEVSRCSLLCGAITSRSDDDEERGFRTHKGLVDVSAAQPPMLFHKRDLLTAGGAELSDELQKELKSAKRRVVGVVVNAVDDHLLRGDQIHFPWTVSHIPVLERLLYAAKEAGRFVVLASDHGHVFDRNARYKAAEPGERYRTDSAAPEQDEIRITGSRVGTPEGAFVAPYVEGLRYGPKKNGYHGGVSPQEVVIPVSVIAPQVDIEGWTALPFAQPEWWTKTRAAGVVSVPTPAPTPKPKARQTDELPLFAQTQKTAGEAGGWIKELFASDMLKSQRKLAGRSTLTDERIREFLDCLEAQGGTMLVSTLAQGIRQPLLRIRGIITAMQRLLNVEGYSVLTYDAASETVSINHELLKRQFELSS